jgi:DNA repair exonuclease SbcCD ATPase subunit
MKKIIFMCILIFFCIVSNSYSKEVPFTLEDRDRIIRIETKLAEIDKRFEQIDKRFEQIDKRFEQIDKRFEQMMTFMWMLVVIFTGITGATVGFAIWDRKTMIRPFETKTKLIEDSLTNDQEKLNTVIEALRSLAKTDEKVAEILKRFNLL